MNNDPTNETEYATDGGNQQSYYDHYYGKYRYYECYDMFCNERYCNTCQWNAERNHLEKIARMLRFKPITDALKDLGPKREKICFNKTIGYHWNCACGLMQEMYMIGSASNEYESRRLGLHPFCGKCLGELHKPPKCRKI